ncbi:hypothetical protein H7H37_22040 [Mycolicibacterium insubricum]|nr:hypothetical protein [Mycolicibacterium insubricum]
MSSRNWSANGHMNASFSLRRLGVSSRLSSDRARVCCGDSQKWVGLAIPGYAVCAAAAGAR